MATLPHDEEPLELDWALGVDYDDQLFNSDLEYGTPSFGPCGEGDLDEYGADDDPVESFLDDEEDPDFEQDVDDDDRSMFADPGGESALRAETSDNPRNCPCPSCKRPNRLTPADVVRGYQCDDCAYGTDEDGY